MRQGFIRQVPSGASLGKECARQRFRPGSLQQSAEPFRALRDQSSSGAALKRALAAKHTGAPDEPAPAVRRLQVI